MKSPKQIVAEMVGRIAPNDFGMAFSKIMSLWGNTQTTDYSRNDYELYRAIYYASIINTKGGEYQMASGFAKAIVNSTAAFVLGNGFTATVDGSDAIEAHSRAEEKLNAFIDANQGLIYDFGKFGYRDGDSFLLLDQEGNVEMLDPDTVEIKYDPVSGAITGYDISETVKEDNNSTTYVREYRKYTITYYAYDNGDLKTRRNLYEVVSTTNGLEAPRTNTDGTPAGYFDGELVEMPLPVIHFANEPEPKAVYGNSDLQNVLVYMKNYSAVLNEAIKNNIYNSTPIPVISGMKNTAALQNARNGTMGWGRDMVIYLQGDDSDAKFLTTSGVMEDTGKLLEYLFYLIVQASETPEFVFGTAIASSRASTETQMPVMIKKAERKRSQIRPVVRRLLEAYVYSQVLAGDPDFYAVYTNKVPLDISWPPIVDEDKKLTLETITHLLDKGILSDKTALELSVIGDRIADKDTELGEARKDSANALKSTGIFPDQRNRVNDELAATADDELNADGTVGDE